MDMHDKTQADIILFGFVLLGCFSEKDTNLCGGPEHILAKDSLAFGPGHNN